MIRDHDTSQGILEHAPWLRAIAHDHARSGLDPDDLVQETLLRALRQPERRNGALRVWLAGILRNTAREAVRSEVRRRFREQVVASSAGSVDPRGTPDHESDWANVEQAVLELREPYGSTISLRYLDGLAPHQIAERQGVPVRTVTTRLSRGLSRLRARLRTRRVGEHGLVWVLLGRLRAGRRGLPVRLVACLGLVASLVTVSLLARFGADPLRGALPGAVADRAEEPSRGARTALEPPAVAGSPTRSPALPETPTELGVERRLTGRVIDASGSPRADVLVAFQPDPAGLIGTVLGRSDAEGRFALRAAPGVSGCAFALSRTEVPLVFERIPTHAARDFVLVVAPRRSVRGVVLDAHGRPVEAAAVSLHRDTEWSTRSDGPAPSRPRTTTDSGGYFELSSAFDLASTVLRIAHPDFAPEIVTLEPGGQADVQVALRTEPAGSFLEGVVLDRNGRGVSAVVSSGHTYVRSERDGAFRLPLAADQEVRVSAAGRGWMSGVRSIDGTRTRESTLLRLTQATSVLRGVVLDDQGRPAVGCEVWLLNPSPFGIRRSGLPGDVGTPCFLESILATDSLGVPAPVTTGAGGAFTLRGLRDGPYQLCLVSSDHRSIATPPPVYPGSGRATFQLPRAEGRAVQGRVLSGSGDPVAGARVTASLAHIDIPVPWNGWRFRRDLVTCEGTTDVEGRFRIDAIPARRLLLTITGADLFPANLLVEGGDLASPLQVLVSRRARLRLSYAGADSFRVLDADGNRLPIAVTSNGLFPVQGEPTFERRLGSGPGPEWSLPADAAEVVLQRGGTELDRLSVQLEPDSLTVLER